MSRFRQIEPAPVVELELPSPLRVHGQDFANGFVIPPHRHRVAQLIHASAGVMTVETAEGLWVVPPQRAVWVPAGVSHAIRMTGRVAMRTVYLAPEIAPLGGDRCAVVQVSELLRAAILRAAELEQPYPAEGPEARLAAVLADEIRAAPVAPLHLPMPADARARRVAEALRADPGDTRRLAGWARVAGASERTLERLFRREAGMPFATWRQQARLLRALEILAAGEPVTAAALAVGFETPSAFIAMFRRAMGTTPARYFRAGRA